MKYKLEKREANLEGAAEKIELFMKNNGFTVSKRKNGNCYQILGLLRTSKGKLRTIKVTLSETEDGLEIELKHGGFMHSILKYSFLISLLGGGALLLDAYDSSEFYQKIEEKFWRYLEEELAKM